MTPARDTLIRELKVAQEAVENVNVTITKVRDRRRFMGDKWADGMVRHYQPMLDTATKAVAKLEQRLDALG